MLESPSILMMIGAFLLVLGPLVVLHELGHYLVARWFGVRSDVFSIGFGKPLCGWTDRRGTRWQIAAIPLGGYVQFAGDANAASVPDPAAVPAPDTLHGADLWKRALIVAAGPFANLLIAVAIFAAFNLYVGKPVIIPEVSGFAEQSDARNAGIKVGDRIVAVDGSGIESATDIAEHVLPYPGRTVTVTVERDGRPLLLPVKLTPLELKDGFGNGGTGAELGISYTAPVIGEVLAGSPAAAAGLLLGDRVVAVGDTPVATFGDIRDVVSKAPGAQLGIKVLRDGRELVLSAKVGAVAGIDEQGKPVQLGQLGIRAGHFEAVGLGEAVVLATDQSLSIMRTMATGIVQIVTGERSVKELGGPIRIAKVSGEQLSLGWEPFVWFAALISINLAFINLLPIPTLDGGHLAFYAAEAIRRRPVSTRSQEWAFRTGLAFVLALMLFVTFNDITSLRLFGS